MIAFIEGIIAHRDPATVVLNVQGVGYEMRISLQTYTKLKNLEKCKLYTILSIREDAHTLYGFFELSEKKLFIELTSISGIGPATALTILSSLSFAELHEAIAREDLRTIQSIKGIGQKTAQRLILELKDKLKKEPIVSNSQNITISSHSIIKNEALDALTVLGIPRAAADKVLDNILKTNDLNITTEELIKIALKSA
ncbi:MAG: Holliday junction branch migration protein RuvA [Cytophagales bacterium]|nr:Holliday junction branch migration protein RuvA [Cytophagales bacterium]